MLTGLQIEELTINEWNVRIIIAAATVTFGLFCFFFNFLNIHVVNTKVQLHEGLHYYRLIYNILINYEPCKVEMHLESIMAHFKTEEETCHTDLLEQ